MHAFETSTNRIINGRVYVEVNSFKVLGIGNAI